MDILAEILRFGTGGLLGAIGFWLYIQEKSEHSKTRQAFDLIQEKWRTSESERADRLMDTVNTASAVQAALVDKMKVGREER